MVNERNPMNKPKKDKLVEEGYQECVPLLE
jgi:hypothetical protein